MPNAGCRTLRDKMADSLLENQGMRLTGARKLDLAWAKDDHRHAVLPVLCYEMIILFRKETHPMSHKTLVRPVVRGGGFHSHNPVRRVPWQPLPECQNWAAVDPYKNPFLKK